MSIDKSSNSPLGDGGKLKLAIQKSGRLHDDSIRLLKECGIDISNGVNKLKADASNFPLEVFFLRDDDIPQYVEDGVADIGFVGENVVFEKNKKVEIVEKLGFGKCRLSIAIRKGETYTDASFLEGKKIATSYPVILEKYLKDNNFFRESSSSCNIFDGFVVVVLEDEDDIWTLPLLGYRLFGGNNHPSNNC